MFYGLEREDGRTTIGDLSARIAAWEEGVPVDDVSPSQRKVAYNSLQQSHLPRLAERDLVVYDRESGVVELTDRGELLDGYLGMVPDRGYRWSRLYLTMAVTACSVVVARTVDAPLVSRVSGETGFAFLAAAILVVAVLNITVQRAGRTGDGEEPPASTERQRE